ncbi:hypothetical protein G7Y79_00018g045580 [Physcia stellaris]|nr:hypothetical protein G7Y79_00018g045580 [Physcia stellaris]
MKNPHSWIIIILILCQGFLTFGIPTLAVPINDNQISNGPRAVDSIHNHHSLSPPSYPPTSLNFLPAPSHLTPLSPRSLKGWTYRVITTHLILPTKTTFHSLITDINATMHSFIRFSSTIDSFAPSSHIKLSYGALRLEFLSPAPIAWTVVAEIVKLHALLGMMFVTLFSRVLWEYVGLVAVTVLFYAVGERPEGIIPV